MSSVWGDGLDGANYNTKRDYGMTVTEPPVDYRWHHSTIVVGQGNDLVHSDYDTKAELHDMRLNWLDQFNMVVTEEGDWRYWRWYDDKHACRWWERRRVTDPLPNQPGLWPSDG